MSHRTISTAALSGLTARVPSGTSALAMLYLLASASTFLWAYIPRQMTALGWTGAQIGIFFMVKTVGQAVATPVWARRADRPGGSGRRLLKVQYLVAALAIALLPVASSWLLGLVIAIMLGATLRCSPPLMDTMTLGTVGMSRFGRIRSFGTIGFGLVALSFGLLGARLDHESLASIAPWVMLAIILFSLPVIKRLPGSEEPAPSKNRNRRSSVAEKKKPDIKKLIQSPVVLLIFPVAALFVATHVPYELFLVGLAEERQFGAWLPGVAIFIGIVGELLGFLSFRKLVRRISPEVIIGIIVAISGLRWLATGTTTSPLLFAGLQILHGLTFAVFFMALLEIMTREWGSTLGATAQSLLYLFVFAAGSGLGTLISGILYDLGSASTLFQQAGIASFVILPALLLALYFVKHAEKKPALVDCVQCTYLHAQSTQKPAELEELQLCMPQRTPLSRQPRKQWARLRPRNA